MEDAGSEAGELRAAQGGASPARIPASRARWVVGLLAAAAFVALASLNFTAQGLQYDELHQAAPAFAWVGTTPPFFAELMLGGIPILNLPYSGALKTGFYGVYLQATGGHFTVESWRLLGILFVATGLFAFCVAAWRGFTPLGWTAFLLLFLSDSTLALETRFDLGPVALGLLLRLLLIATWIRGETGDRATSSNGFWLGFWCGVAVFEKLSAIALGPALLLMLVLSPRRRTWRHVGFCVLGGLVGSGPMIFANLYTWTSWGFPISLSSVHHVGAAALSWPRFLGDYLSLASSDVVRRFFLGGGGPEAFLAGARIAEIAAIAAILSLGVYRAAERWRRARAIDRSTILLGCYAVVALGLYLLPAVTDAHHWILGTPFQYAAVGLICSEGWDVGVRWRRRGAAALFVVVLALLGVVRTAGTATLVRSLARGDASIHWDASLTHIGLFAHAHADEAVFVAADWGVATQIFCLSDAHPLIVYEPYWGYRSFEQIRRYIAASGRNAVYLVTKKPRRNANPQVTARIFHDVETAPDLREVPVEQEVRDLRAVEVRKFVVVARPPTPGGPRPDPARAPSGP